MRRQQYYLKITLALLAGSITGLLLSKAWNSINQRSKLRARTSDTAALLKNMQTISIGMRLNDGTFEDLDDSAVSLLDIVDEGVTVICIVRPECDACLYDIEEIDKYVRRGALSSRSFVFISSANPRLMADIRDAVESDFQFLYDHRAKWISQYKINNFPFAILVDSSLNVLDVFVGTLLPQDIERLTRRQL